MMPTRLQDGLSVSLLQWMRSADKGETRSVIVRVVETETVSQVAHNLTNAGMEDIEFMTNTSMRGRVNSDVLSRIVHSPGVCSVTEDYDIRR